MLLDPLLILSSNMQAGWAWHMFVGMMEFVWELLELRGVCTVREFWNCGAGVRCTVPGTVAFSLQTLRSLHL